MAIFAVKTWKHFHTKSSYYPYSSPFFPEVPTSQQLKGPRGTAGALWGQLQ